jgi:hypothetical protein
MTSQFLTLGEIQIGEPDANAEYFSALRGHREPLFLNAFLMTPHLPMKEIISGEKFILHGQKGTGKTASLRYIEKHARQNGPVEFLIFKKAFIEEIDLQAYAKLPLFVDEEEIKKFKHYHHALKRVFIYILLSLTLHDNREEDFSTLEDENKSLMSKLMTSKIGDVIKLAFDSLSSLIQVSTIDIGKFTDSKVLLDASKAIKRNNDDLLEFLCRRLSRFSKPVRLIIDEIHFAYRSEESLQQDAILVRDCIMAVHSLNDRFAQEDCNCAIYAAVRSEYLEHPIISTADINHSIESVGVNINWSTYSLNASHPLFSMLYNRFKAAMGRDFKMSQFMSVYFANMAPEMFLSRTWNKPRDFIRFFKCAKELFPGKSTLTESDSNSVWRRYAHDAWNEMKSSASPFLSPEALSILENTLRENVPHWFQNKKITVQEFGEIMRPIYEKAKGGNVNFYDFQHFLTLLYILGLFGTRHEGSGFEITYQTYHRGNRSFHPQGEVQIHPTVLKAFG